MTVVVTVSFYTMGAAAKQHKKQNLFLKKEI